MENKMEYKVIDNVLLQKDFLNIKSHVLSDEFFWNLSTKVTKARENLPCAASYYFTHTFYQGYYQDQYIQVLSPLLIAMDCKALIRVKANLYPSTETRVTHPPHRDFDYSHKGAIFYLNTNDGLTILEDGTEIESVENRLLLFDSYNFHSSTTCTNDQCRININFNFF